MGQIHSEIKDKIIFFIKTNGPSLPVHIAKYIKSDILFTSAFLSELISEKLIKISNIKIGNSPLYYLAGQEYSLERFSNYLKSKEKEAFNLLKEKKFLKDSALPPAIRVALRSIKDFAIPFKNNEELFWRYFTIPESDFLILNKIKNQEIKKEEKQEETKIEILSNNTHNIPKIKPSEINVGEQTKKEKKLKKRNEIKEKNENFFNIVKSWTNKNSMEIVDIISLNKKELYLKVKVNSEEFLLIAYNKKKILDSDIIKANKKAKELGLKYNILSLGEPTKKMISFIEAIKNLSEIKKIE
ncbi:MAG: hypothetical protein QXX55_01320 [Candidatus Pacearchaeota archaeon]